MTKISVNGRQVGPGNPCYMVAELSCNHGGSFDRAVDIIRLAAASGADAIKVQTYRPDTMTLNSPREAFVVEGNTLWDGRTLFDLYAEGVTPWDWHGALKEEARRAGIDFFSSPFDLTAVEFLVELDVPALKIASFELVDHPLVAHAARQNRPLIMSTGMAEAGEIEEALAVAREAGASEIVLLHCNSAYPAPLGEMDLRTIPDMGARWEVPVGLSDHTLGSTAAVVAVTLGACLIEKHFIDTRSKPSLDSAFSLEPQEFRTMVDSVREAEAALGSVRYGPSPHERASLSLRRSLFVTQDVGAGEPLTDANVRSIRPGHGLDPKHLDSVLGRTAARDVSRGTPLTWDLLT